MLSADNMERFWDVCDDLGVSVDEDTIVLAWSKYCRSHGLPESSDLPVGTGKLFEVVKESLALLEADECVSV